MEFLFHSTLFHYVSLYSTNSNRALRKIDFLIPNKKKGKPNFLNFNILLFPLQFPPTNEIKPKIKTLYSSLPPSHNSITTQLLPPIPNRVFSSTAGNTTPITLFRTSLVTPFYHYHYYYSMIFKHFLCFCSDLCYSFSSKLL